MGEPPPRAVCSASTPPSHNQVLGVKAAQKAARNARTKRVSPSPNTARRQQQRLRQRARQVSEAERDKMSKEELWAYFESFGMEYSFPIVSADGPPAKRGTRQKMRKRCIKKQKYCQQLPTSPIPPMCIVCGWWGHVADVKGPLCNFTRTASSSRRKVRKRRTQFWTDYLEDKNRRESSECINPFLELDDSLFYSDLPITPSQPSDPPLPAHTPSLFPPACTPSLFDPPPMDMPPRGGRGRRHGAPRQAPPQQIAPPPPAPQGQIPQEAAAAAQAGLNDDNEFGRNMYMRANVQYPDGTQGSAFTIPCGFRKFFKDAYHYIERDATYVSANVTRLRCESFLLHNNYITFKLGEEYKRASDLQDTEWDMFVTQNEQWYMAWLAAQVLPAPALVAADEPQLPKRPPPVPICPLVNAPAHPARFNPLQDWVRFQFKMGRGRPAYPYAARDLPTFSVPLGVTLLGQCLQAVSWRPENHMAPKSVNNNPQLSLYARLHYYPYRPAEPFARSEGLTAILAAVANEMDVNFRIMISENIPNRIKQDLKRRIWNGLQPLNGGNGRQKVTFSKRTAQGVAGHIYGLLYKGNAFSLSNTMLAYLDKAEQRQAFNHNTLRESVTKILQDVYWYIKEMCHDRDLKPAMRRVQWHQWVPLLYHIQSGLDSQQDVKGLFRHFSMAPHGSTQMNMVLFSTAGLFELFALSKTMLNHQNLPAPLSNAIRNFPLPRLEDLSPAEAVDFWRLVTNFPKFESNVAQTHKFGCSFRTDGIGTRISMRKPTSSGEPLDLEKWLEKDVADRDLRGKLVASCDPGRVHTTYHACVDVPMVGIPRPPLDPRNFNNYHPDYDRGFSTKEYYHRAGFDWQK
ncbi:hypothetical protein HDU93_009904 [Gonapodya sp. JEL0774]|nr:hypothetical protein HDU93_009904 [Gonapodya sp. JEL0774]